MQAHKMSENRQMSVHSEMGHLELATSKMVVLLEKLHAYVEDVLSGKVEGDVQVGRTLMEALSKVPNIPPAQFDTLLNNSMQVSRRGDWRRLSLGAKCVHMIIFLHLIVLQHDLISEYSYNAIDYRLGT